MFYKNRIEALEKRVDALEKQVNSLAYRVGEQSLRLDSLIEKVEMREREAKKQKPKKNYGKDKTEPAK